MGGRARANDLKLDVSLRTHVEENSNMYSLTTFVCIFLRLRKSAELAGFEGAAAGVFC